MKYELTDYQRMDEVPLNTTHLVCVNMRLDTLEGMPTSVTQLHLMSCSIGSLKGMSPRTVVLVVNNCNIKSLQDMTPGVYDLQCSNLGIRDWRFTDTKLMLFTAERCNGLENLELPASTTKVKLRGTPNLKTILGPGVTTMELAPDMMHAVSMVMGITHVITMDAVDCMGLAGTPATVTGVTVDKAVKSLRGMPATVTKIQCQGSVKLDKLDHVPAGLQVLECKGSSVHSLAPLAKTRLKYLDCSGSAIENLIGLPETTEAVVCSNCAGLSELTGLPSRIKHLDCSGNQWLDDEAFRRTTFPSTLKLLNVTNCRLQPPYPLRLHMVPKVIGIDTYKGSLFRVKHSMVRNGEKAYAML